MYWRNREPVSGKTESSWIDCQPTKVNQPTKENTDWRIEAALSQILKKHLELAPMVSRYCQSLASQSGAGQSVIDAQSGQDMPQRICQIRWRDPLFYHRDERDTVPDDLPWPILVELSLVSEESPNGAHGDASLWPPNPDMERLYFLAVPRLLMEMAKAAKEEKEQAEGKSSALQLEGTAPDELSASDGTPPKMPSDHQLKTRPSFKGGGIRLFHLNGTSPPILKVNSKLRGINLNYAEEYLDFFSSFVSGEEGPFCALQDDTDLIWAAYDDNANFFKGTYLDLLIRDIWENEEPDRPKNFGDFKKEFISGVGDRWKISPRIEAEKDGDQLSSTVEVAKKFDALIQYSQAVFKAEMSVSADGSITMDDDSPILREYLPFEFGLWRFEEMDKALNLRLLRFQKADSGTNNASKQMNLARVPPVPVMRPGDYAKDVEGRLPHEQKWTKELVGLKITGGQEAFDLNRPNQTFYGPIRFSGIKFFGSLDLSNTEISKDLIFENCEIMGGVNLSNCRLSGNLKFIGCDIYGLSGQDRREPEDQDEPNSTNESAENKADSAATASRQSSTETRIVWIDGATIDGDLVFEKCTINGSLSLRNARIGGRSRFEGLQLVSLAAPLWIKDKTDQQGGNGTETNETTNKSVKEFKVSKRFLPKEDRDGGGVALDLRYTSFGRGLDLTAWTPQKTVSGMVRASQKVHEDVVPTFINGHVLGNGCRIDGPLVLCGVVTADLNPDVFDFDTYIGWEEKGSFWHLVDFANSEITGEVTTWARSKDPTKSFEVVPTYLSGGLDLGNCRVSGSVDLRGIWLGQDLNARHLHVAGGVYLQVMGQEQIDARQENFFNLPLHSGVGGHAEGDEAADGQQPLWKIDERRRVFDERQSGWRLTRTGRTHIEGNMQFRGARIDGRLELNGCFVGKDIICSEAELGSIHAETSVNAAILSENYRAAPVCDYIAMDGVDPKKNGLLQYIRAHKATVLFPLNDKVTVVDVDGDDVSQKVNRLQDLYLRRTEAARFEMRDSTIRGSVDLSGMWLSDSGFDEPEARSRQDGVIADRMNGCRTCAENGLTYDPPEDQNRAKWEDRLIVENCEIFGPLRLSNRKFCSETGRDIASDESQNFYFRQFVPAPENKSQNNVNRNDWKDAYCKFFQSTIPPAFLAVHCDGHVQITNSKIDGELELRGAIIDGNLEIRDVNLTSDLILASRPDETEYPEPKKVLEDVAGRKLHRFWRAIKRSFSSLGGSMLRALTRIRNLFSRRALNSEKDANNNNLQVEPGKRPAISFARNVYLEMLRCDGDVFLSGMRTPGKLQGHNMRISGTLDLTDEQAFEDSAERCTQKMNKYSRGLEPITAIAQDKSGIDFTGSTIAFLRLGGQPANQSSQSVKKTEKWSLERVAVKRLDVRKPYPNMVDLRSTSFERLTIAETDKNENDILEFLSVKPDAYTNEPFARMEKLLRTQGRRRAANKVYSKMMWSWLNDRKWYFKPWYWVYAFFYGLLTGFGLGKIRLATGAVALWILTFSLLTGPSQNWIDGVAPTIPDRVLAALDISVPVVPLGPKNGWHLRQSQLWHVGPAWIGWDGCSSEKNCDIFGLNLKIRQESRSTNLLSPQNVRSIFTLLGWIIWPVLILVFAGFMRREH